MKYSKADVHCKAHKVPEIRFECQSLTSFSGLVVFQELFKAIDLKTRVRRCFQHLYSGKIFGHAAVFLQLVLHIILGFRDLRDGGFYSDDPLVKRILGLKRLPDVGTISRTLKDADEQSVQRLRQLLQDMVFDRLGQLCLSRITLDFDGSVQSTGRFAEGTAVGFNKTRRGRAAITRCSARSCRRVRCSTFCIDRATYTTQRVPGPSCWPAFGRLSWRPPVLRSKCVSTAPFSATRSSLRWKSTGPNSHSASRLNGFHN